MKLSKCLAPAALAIFVVALGRFVAPDVADAAKAVCGDDVREGPEDCDGIDDARCPDQCQMSCTCPSLEERVEALEAIVPLVSCEVRTAGPAVLPGGNLALTVACEAGEILTGGACDLDFDNNKGLGVSRPRTDGMPGWVCRVDTSAEYTMAAYAICCK